MCKAVSAHVALPHAAEHPCAKTQGQRVDYSLTPAPTSWTGLGNSVRDQLEVAFISVIKAFRESCFPLTWESVQVRDK